MRRGMMRLAMAVAALALVATACPGEGAPPEDEGPGEGVAQPAGDGLLAEIRDRGTLRCGVNNAAPGLGFETAEGQIEGFDIDFCVGIAAAVFGTPDPQEGQEYQLIPTTTEERFDALVAGQFDVLTRNTTWTSSRDGALGVAFAHTNFYDAQAMMVKEGEFSSFQDLDGANICVLAGTTTELNLADFFQQEGLAFTPVVFATNDEVLPAFRQDRCQGWTSDLSQLAGLRTQYEQELGALEIFPEAMSKEPLGPAVVDGDQEWLDVVNWVVNGLILAEELGVTQGNVEQMASDPPNPSVATMLGVTFEAPDETVEVDHGLGVDNDFMQNVLAAVGNYGEIFDRHLGAGSPLGLERGLNALWTEDGIQYAIPMR